MSYVFVYRYVSYLSAYEFQLRSECAEIVRGIDGFAFPVGNCVGGATTINLGLYIEEMPSWIVEHLGEGFGTEDEVKEAYEWVSDNTTRVQ